MHVASVTLFGPDPNKVIPPVIAGAVNAASAAAKHSSVKRFVFTSSSAASTAPKPKFEYTLSTDQWNTEAIEAAWKPSPLRKQSELASLRCEQDASGTKVVGVRPGEQSRFYSEYSTTQCKFWDKVER